MPFHQRARKYVINTPSRKKAIKRLTRKSYTSLATGIFSSPNTSRAMISQLALKIKKEMRELSSDRHDSILRDTIEAVKRFSWETVYLELCKMTPILMSLLAQLIPSPEDYKPLMCTIASQLLKCRHQRLSLVQRAVSVMDYFIYLHFRFSAIYSPLTCACPTREH